jgi:hypothetical protein
MASKLSRELIHEILALHGVCNVDDETFVDSSPLSHTVHLNRSIHTSAIFVSKNWFCAGTPLLYETIILHSQKQARALLYTLRKTPSLGMHVRKLRLHRSFGLSMEHILRSCPRITDLFISLVLTPKDNVLGICAGLSFISPTRVILHDPPQNYHTNTNVSALVEKLCECIPVWTTLACINTSLNRVAYSRLNPACLNILQKTLHFPYNDMNLQCIGLVPGKRYAHRVGEVRSALLGAKHVTTFYIPCVDKKSFILYNIADNQLNHIKVIYSQAPLESGLFHALVPRPLADPTLCRVLRFPLPGPWVNRPYVSINEVADV